MPDKHPYVPSLGGLSKAITHFRKSFPASVNAVTSKKLGFAPNNESYVMNVLRFLNLIKKDDKRSDNGLAIFSHHDDGAFANAFEAQVRDSYSGLFDPYGEQSWNLDRDALISFFRTSDQTTEIVGKRQTTTFQLLAKFAGRGGPPQNTTRELIPLTGSRRSCAVRATSRNSDRTSLEECARSPNETFILAFPLTFVSSSTMVTIHKPRSKRSSLSTRKYRDIQPAAALG